jgi:ABC-2 type transport system ATP-binding protein
VVACDRTEALVRRLDHKELVLIFADDLAAVPPALERFGAALAGPRRLVLHYRPSETRVADILAAVDQAGLQVADLSTREPDLEDLFVELTRDGGQPG